MNTPDHGGSISDAYAQTEENQYTMEIEAWDREREEGLRKPTSWLSVIGLLPLSPGDNTFGSATDNAVVLPAGAPAHAGVLRLTNGVVTVEIAGGVTVTHENQPVASRIMIPDTEEGTTYLDLGSLQFHVIERNDVMYIRLKDRNSKAIKSFSGIARFPILPDWKIEARWEPYDPPREIEVPSILGYLTKTTSPGVAVFDIHGKTVRLEPMGDTAGGLFFVFGDLTNEIETYGGGRFLYTDPIDAGGTLILDFNKAYNPPCVFTDYATCPLPVSGNKLKFRIEAGEKMYGNSH